MSFNFRWPTFSDAFHQDATAMLDAALNKGTKPKVIADDIKVEELGMGTIVSHTPLSLSACTTPEHADTIPLPLRQAPELDILEIGDLSTDRFRGIFRLTYAGDAHLVLSTKVQANPLSAGRTSFAPSSSSSSSSSASTPAAATSYEQSTGTHLDLPSPPPPEQPPPASPFGYGQQHHNYDYDFTPISSPLTSSLFGSISAPATRANSGSATPANASSSGEGAAAPHAPSSATRRGILFAASPLIVPMKLRLSHLRLRAIIVLIVSKTKGITLVFKNDPLESVTVSSTFDSVAVLAKYLQQEIEGQLREMFREDLPAIIHRLSQKWLSEGFKKDASPASAPAAGTAAPPRSSSDPANLAGRAASERGGSTTTTTAAAQHKGARSSTMASAPASALGGHRHRRSLAPGDLPSGRHSRAGSSASPMLQPPAASRSSVVGNAHAPPPGARSRHGKAASMSGASAVVNNTVVVSSSSPAHTHEPPRDNRPLLRRNVGSTASAPGGPQAAKQLSNQQQRGSGPPSSSRVGLGPRSSSARSLGHGYGYGGALSPPRADGTTSRNSSVFSALSGSATPSSSGHSHSQSGAPRNSTATTTTVVDGRGGSSHASLALSGLEDPTSIETYDPTYGFQNDDPLTPASRDGGPPGFSGLGSLLQNSKPGLGLKELVPRPPSPLPGEVDEEEGAEGELNYAAGAAEEDGDAESVEPLDSDFEEGDEEEALDFYFPQAQYDDDDEEEREESPSAYGLGGLEEEDEDTDEEVDRSSDLQERRRGDPASAEEEEQDDVEDEPGDFSKFGYPPPDAAYAQTAVDSDRLSVAFSTSPTRRLEAASAPGGMRRRTGSKGSASVSSPPPVVEMETVPAVGGGFVTRPRVFHFASYARTPEMSLDEQSSVYAGSRTGDDTVRGTTGTGGGENSRAATIVGGGTPRVGASPRPAHPAVDGSSPPKRNGRWINWGEIEEAEGREERDGARRNGRRDPSGTSTSSKESGSLDSLPPEPVDTTTYEFRSREYRQKYGIPLHQHWEPKRGDSASKLLKRRESSSRENSLGHDTASHFSDLLHAGQTLSPFTRSMEGVALRSAPLTPGSENGPGHTSEMLATPALLRSRLQAVHGSRKAALQQQAQPSHSTPPRALQAQQPMGTTSQADAADPPKARRRRVFKLGSSAPKQEPAEAVRVEEPMKRNSSAPSGLRYSAPASAASSHPRSAGGSSHGHDTQTAHSPRASRSSSYSPLPSQAGHADAGQDMRRRSLLAGPSSAARSNAARWGAIRE